MNRARLLVILLLTGAFVGTAAAPALAGDGSTQVCVLATNDRNNAGPPAFCVFVPVE